jgi:hypothetical protein
MMQIAIDKWNRFLRDSRPTAATSAAGPSISSAEAAPSSSEPEPTSPLFADGVNSVSADESEEDTPLEWDPIPDVSPPGSIGGHVDGVQTSESWVMSDAEPDQRADRSVTPAASTNNLDQNKAEAAREKEVDNPRTRLKTLLKNWV